MNTNDKQSCHTPLGCKDNVSIVNDFSPWTSPPSIAKKAVAAATAIVQTPPTPAEETNQLLTLLRQYKYPQDLLLKACCSTPLMQQAIPLHIRKTEELLEPIRQCSAVDPLSWKTVLGVRNNFIRSAMEFYESEGRQSCTLRTSLPRYADDLFRYLEVQAGTLASSVKKNFPSFESGLYNLNINPLDKSSTAFCEKILQSPVKIPSSARDLKQRRILPSPLKINRDFGTPVPSLVDSLASVKNLGLLRSSMSLASSTPSTSAPESGKVKGRPRDRNGSSASGRSNHKPPKKQKIGHENETVSSADICTIRGGGSMGLMGAKGMENSRYQSRVAVVHRAKVSREKNSKRNLLLASTAEPVEPKNLTWRERQEELRRPRVSGQFLCDVVGEVRLEGVVSFGRHEVLEVSLKHYMSEVQSSFDQPTFKEACALSLQKHFGLSHFKKCQRKAITSVLSKPNSSTLVILPTGAGKSLIYQFCAFHISKELKHLTVVVVPTLPLLKDQLDRAPPRLTIGRLDHTLSYPQRLKLFELLTTGQLDVLLTTPEQLVLESSLNFQSHPLGLLVIDEAHCLSEWGHSFRPAYLSVLQRAVRQMSAPRILALTATATPSTSSGICRQMMDVNLKTQVIHPPIGAQRNDLHLTVGTCEDDMAGCNLCLFRANRELLKQKDWRRMRSVVLYVWQTYVAEALCRDLQGSTSSTVVYYHSKLSPIERDRIVSAFLQGSCRFVVATMALGMGVDKRDVDGVVHVHMPASLEQYVQETGRCNRNGSSIGRCHLFLRDEDFRRRHLQIAGSSPDLVSLKRFLSLLSGWTRDEVIFDPSRSKISRDRSCRTLLLSMEETCLMTNSRQVDDAAVLVAVLGASLAKADGPDLFVLPAKFLEFRFYDTDLVELPDFEFLNKHARRRDGCGTYVLDIGNLVAAEGFSIDLQEFESNCQALCRIHKATCTRTGEGLVVLRAPVKPFVFEGLADDVEKTLGLNNRVQINRLCAAYLAFNAGVIGGEEALRRRVEAYFSWPEGKELADDIWTQEELDTLALVWPTTAGASVIEDQLVETARVVAGSLAVELERRSPRLLVDSSSPLVSCSPKMVARVLAGLSGYLVDWKNRRVCGSAWNRYGGVRFEVLEDAAQRCLGS